MPRRAKAKKEKGFSRCARCYRIFPSRKALHVHSRQHLQALHEIKMLEEGFVPVESKIGEVFKGKNKIIVS